MDVKIPEEMARKWGEKTLRKYGIEENSFTWQKFVVVNLRGYTLTEIKELRELVSPYVDIRGGRSLLKDIETWIKTIEKGHYPSARTVEQFTDILIQMIARVEGHRIYKRDDAEGNVWLCYYVEEINYHPKRETSNGNVIPCHCIMDLKWEEFGGRREIQVTFWDNECVLIKPEEALIRKGLYCETPEMREAYLKEVERYKQIVPLMGKQYFAVGMGMDDVDGNSNRRHSESWWYRRNNRIQLDKNGEPSRVVVDLFYEDDKEQQSQDRYLNTWFWHSSSHVYFKKGDKEERADLPIEDVEEQPVIEIPIHPYLACFDMKRQMRLKIHVGSLTEYIYDATLGSKLILPKVTTDLVDMLVAHKGVFKDIIKGKGGGVIVLCTGQAGTGKTLTAEVYAEVTSRPLYSVQASQLGTKPEELEDELLKIFTRSQRWNAILLLDEADVYVHRRGDSLQQNAIVGVFLRVLEYYNGVMFLTTNRGFDVDDAIASRCVARIEYEIPTIDDQKRIWRVLSDVTEIGIDEDTINRIVEKHSDLSGRDIKNLLKLGKLVSDARNTTITPEIIDFVKHFKPTQTDKEDK